MRLIYFPFQNYLILIYRVNIHISAVDKKNIFVYQLLQFSMIEK